MVIDQAKPVLTAVDHDIRADFIDHPGDTSAIGENAVNRFLGKDIGLGAGITELMAYVFTGPAPVVVIQDTLYVYPLAYRLTFFQ